MSKLNESKLNRLLRNWPKGTVATLMYLKTRNYSKDLIHRYIKSNWIEPIGRGAYKLIADDIDWTGGVFALQECSKLNIHPGAKTVFQLKGYSHYISPIFSEIFLFANVRTKLPTWFRSYKWNTKIFYTSTNLFSENINESFTELDINNQYSIKISSVERASIEMLHLLPNGQSFEEADLLMESLYYLRPELVQRLLENCNSIKAKRLFMYFANKHKLDWLKKIDANKIDFGRGNRAIVKKGVLDKTYKITVPEPVDEEEVLF